SRRRTRTRTRTRTRLLRRGRRRFRALLLQIRPSVLERHRPVEPTVGIDAEIPEPLELPARPLPRRRRQRRLDLGALDLHQGVGVHLVDEALPLFRPPALAAEQSIIEPHLGIDSIRRRYPVPGG